MVDKPKPARAAGIATPKLSSTDLDAMRAKRRGVGVSPEYQIARGPSDPEARQDKAPPPRPAGLTRQSKAPPPRPAGLTPQSKAPPPRPAGLSSKSKAPPPRPAGLSSKSGDLKRLELVNLALKFMDGGTDGKSAPESTTKKGIQNFDKNKADAEARRAASQVQKKAKGGKVSEYGGKETYKSKSAMMKHEGKESKSMEKKESRMAMGGKCRGMGAATKGGNYKG